MKKSMTLLMLLLLITLTGCIRMPWNSRISYIVHIVYFEDLYSSPYVVHESETLGEALGTPTKINSEFLYWENMDGERFYLDDTITSHQFLYVVFNDLIHQISFETNGGTIIEPIFLRQGTFYVPPVPLRTGYIFKGWYTDEALTQAYSSVEPIQGDMVLYAEWGFQEYTVFYRFSDNEWYRFAVTPDDLFPIMDTSEVENFDYWYETNPSVPFEFPSSMPSRNIVLYAKYKS